VEAVLFPAEIDTVGIIHAITLYNNFTQSLMNKPTKVWLGVSALENLSSGFIPSTSLDLVFDGNVDYPAGQNQVTITLQEQFAYAGGNLVLLVFRPWESDYFASTNVFYAQTVGSNRARKLTSTSASVDPANPNMGVMSGQFPQTTLHLLPLEDDPLYMISADSHAFGAVLVNTTHSQDFTIFNMGGGTLTIQSIELSGSPHFSLLGVPDLPLGLALGQTIQFTARYLPTEGGFHESLITITDDQRVPHYVDLSGFCQDNTVTSLPYAQNFDALNPPELPWDWNRIVQSSATGAFVRTSSDNPHTLLNCAQMFNSTDLEGEIFLIAPPLAVNISLADVRVRFWARSIIANYPLGVGILSDPSNPSSFDQVAQVTLANTFWTEYTVLFDSYAGTGRYIAFKHLHGGPSRNIYLDTIAVESVFDTDLAALSVIGNRTPSVGFSSDYTVRLRNWGAVVQSAYQVKLLSTQGTELASIAGPEIGPGQALDVILPWTPTTAGLLNIRAVAFVAGDQNPANDQSEAFSVEVQFPETILVTVGSGQQQDRFPFDFHWMNSLYETLYFPQEMSYFSGLISGIRFYSNFFSDLSQKPISLWLGTTAQPNLAGGWIGASDLTLVYDGVYDFPAGPNVVEITLSEPFSYTDGQNLVLLAQGIGGFPVGHELDNFFTQTVGTNRGRMVHSDYTTYDPYAPPSHGYVSGIFPKTSFLAWPADHGILSGHVYAPNGDPIQGAQVSAVTYQAGSDFQGSFVLYLPAGTYDVTVSAPGFADLVAFAVLIQSYQTTTLDFQFPVANADQVSVPLATGLRVNYPNPFNPSTTIRFDLREQGMARLGIYNAKGQLIRVLAEDEFQAGSHSVVWDGRDGRGNALGSGIYLVKMSCGGHKSILRMVMIK